MTLGRDLCGNWDEAVRREWLVANGLGGYACGTVALANTRRYHGFLMASLAPPVERTLLVAKVEVSVDYLGRRYALTSNEFADGTVDPRGFATSSPSPSRTASRSGATRSRTPCWNSASSWPRART